jgi:transcriptional regulator with GAF, ATPase, and Fis domain
MEKSEKYQVKELPEQPHWKDVQQDVGILGDSAEIRRLIETIDQVAKTDISILITGESGTGKELVGKAVHLRSRRRNEPLITVNSGAIPEGILESELFGHEKGSFTGAIGPRKGYFELANKGSIFLDEIGELPLSIQVKLLRVLEEREFMRVGGSAVLQVDVRFITATNKDLDAEVKKGNFREDLFYRLNAMHIRVPSLRERKDDIPILARKFASDFCRENHIEFGGFENGAFHILQEYHWPGNIRELKNIVEKAIVMERGARIDAQTMLRYIPRQEQNNAALPVRLELPREEMERELLLRILLEIKSEISQLRQQIQARPVAPYLGPWRGEIDNVEPYSLDRQESRGHSVADMEREMIADALRKTGGNKRKAAELLGMSERTLYRKIDKYGFRNNG